MGDEIQREREKCGYKLQNDQNRDSQRDHLGSAPAEENPATVRHRPLRTFLRRKEGVELCTVDRVSRHRTGLQWKVKVASVGPRQHIAHSDTTLWSGMVTELTRSSRVTYRTLSSSVEKREILAQILFLGQMGKSESLKMTGSTLNSEARFSHLELSRQFPPAPTLHSHLSFNCAKKKTKVHGLCQSTPVCRKDRSSRGAPWAGQSHRRSDVCNVGMGETSS